MLAQSLLYWVSDFIPYISTSKYKISNKLHFPVIIGFNFSVSGGKEVWVRSAWALDAPRFLPLGDASAAVDYDKVDVPWVEAEQIESERVSRTVVRKLTVTDRLLGCIEHWIKSFTYFLLRTVSSGYAGSSLLCGFLQSPEGGYFLAVRRRFSCWWPLSLRAQAWGAQAKLHVACGIFLGQESNRYPLHWQADS